MERYTLITATFAILTLPLFGCTTMMEAPKSSASSMAIVEPYLQGKMRVGLNFQSYVYKEKQGMVIINQGENRLICPDAINQASGQKYKPQNFTGASQCYYPNLNAGTYILDNYPLVRSNETYNVFFVQMHNTVTFGGNNIKFSIRPGEVKHVGRYVVHIKDSGKEAKVVKVESLSAAPSINKARLELTRAKSAWALP